ncbi:MAG: DAK2 domain-containing protein [Fusobacteriota bacterium]
MKAFNNETLYNAFIAGAYKVIDHKDLLNKINVFPVPDNDTGNNLAATMESIISESKINESIKETMESVSEAALLGARGNSGIIFAKFIAGFTNELQGEVKISIADFSSSINKATFHVYESISEPIEGTMITVIKNWARSVKDLKEDVDNFPELIEKSLVEAKNALKNTKNQLEVLKKADVVDAGGQGFVKFIEGIYESITGKKNIKPKDNLEKLEFSKEDFISDFESDFRYCTEALMEEVDLSEKSIENLIEDLGDSLIVVKTKYQVRVHIHTDFPSEIFDILRKYGKITRQKVDDMYMQYLIANKRRADIALITDSIADIPQKLLDKYHINVVNLNLIIDGINYLDKLSVTADTFYKRLDEVIDYPTSSQPTIKQLKKVFDSLKGNYESVIAITVSKELSGTWNIFNQAAKKYKKDFKQIEVINSKLNSNAQGLLVLEAAEAISRNEDFDEVVEYIRELRNHINIYVSVDELKYMIKGGRVSPMKGFFANLLNLKPIISLDKDGKGIAFGKSFSSGGVKNKIKKIISEIESETGIKRYSIVHANDLEKAKEYYDIFEEILGKKADYITDISPIIGLNSGIGSVAISIIKDN